MANSKTKTEYSAHATVDTAPEAAGYFTDVVAMKRQQEAFFTFRGAGASTVVLQYKCAGDADWTDYVTDVDVEKGVGLILKGWGNGFSWRAGVKEGGYGSGSVTFGFDW